MPSEQARVHCHSDSLTHEDLEPSISSDYQPVYGVQPKSPGSGGYCLKRETEETVLLHKSLFSVSV